VTGLALLVSDVDGTLVTPDKILTPASVAAAAMLGPAGIGLSLVSARPPRGMAKLVKALSISLPCAGFNGAVIYEPSGAVIEGRWLAPHTAPARGCSLATTGSSPTLKDRRSGGSDGRSTSSPPSLPI
jgi:hypothetical protein